MAAIQKSLCQTLPIIQRLWIAPSLRTLPLEALFGSLGSLKRLEKIQAPPCRNILQGFRPECGWLGCS